MALAQITDVDYVLAAVTKAREHARERGKPIQLDRVAVFLGVSYEDVNAMMNYEGQDEERVAIRNALKSVKQESRADIVDALSDKGNVTGYIFQGKVNHGMVETTAHDVRFTPVTFEGADEVPE